MALTAVFLSCSAYAMTPEEARGAVLANEPGAAGAGRFWMYRSSETDGMWVVYATGLDTSTALFRGGACFVTPDRAVSLGYTRSLRNWGFYSCAPQEPAEELGDTDILPALYVAQGPELMVSTADRLYAWRLDPASRLPTMIDTGKLISIDSMYGVYTGMVSRSDHDIAVLFIDEGDLKQIAAAPIGESMVRGFPDAPELLDRLSEQGYTTTGFLYRAYVPGSVEGPNDLLKAAGVISVGLEKDGQPWHTYLYYPAPGQALEYISDWDYMSDWRGGDRWIVVYEGRASDRLDAGLETVETNIR